MSGITDLVSFVQGLTHLVGTTPSSTQSAATQALRKRRFAMRITDAAAGTTDTTYYLMNIPVAGTITAISVIPGAALTADDTNYKTLTFGTNNGAGGAVTTVAAQTTKATGGSGSWVAGTKLTIALSATIANRSFAAGSQFQLAITHAGSGVAEPIYTVVVEYTED